LVSWSEQRFNASASNAVTSRQMSPLSLAAAAQVLGGRRDFPALSGVAADTDVVVMAAKSLDWRRDRGGGEGGQWRSGLATVPERGAPIVPRRLLRLAAGRFQLSNRLTLNQRVPGSSPGAPTIQSPQTAGFRYDAK
jgi:hypothetical protein